MVAAREKRVGTRPADRRFDTKTGLGILLIADDKALARLIHRRLRYHNYRLQTVPDPLVAREVVDVFRPDLVLLDLDTGHSCGFDLIADIRSRMAVPIVALSSRVRERDIVAALEQGADDFVAKPFGLDELLARIRVALRHVAKPDRGADGVMQVGELLLDLERRQILRDGQTAHLTPTEYRLLKVFAIHPDRYLPDKWLIDEVWGPSWRGGEHILHVYVARLRKKLEIDATHPRHLVTESDAGYRFARSGR
jgi:two-component system, OmpR family, KDP operon response regulator KdpE